MLHILNPSTGCTVTRSGCVHPADSHVFRCARYYSDNEAVGAGTVIVIIWESTERTHLAQVVVQPVSGSLSRKWNTGFSAFKLYTTLLRHHIVACIQNKHECLYKTTNRCGRLSCRYRQLSRARYTFPVVS